MVSVLLRNSCCRFQLDEHYFSAKIINGKKDKLKLKYKIKYLMKI